MDESRTILEEITKDYEIIKNTDKLEKDVEEKILKNAINFL